MFDKEGRAVGFTRPLGEAPATKTLSGYRAVYARPMAECTREQYEEAVRGRREEHRPYEGQRRKLKRLSG